VSACVSQTQMLDNMQPMAMHPALDMCEITGSGK
jgi:hypothetical protein